MEGRRQFAQMVSALRDGLVSRRPAALGQEFVEGLRALVAGGEGD